MMTTAPTSAELCKRFNLEAAPALLAALDAVANVHDRSRLASALQDDLLADKENRRWYKRYGTIRDLRPGQYGTLTAALARARQAARARAAR